MPKKELIVVIAPFLDERFKVKWNLWRDYKKAAYNFTYKDPYSEQAALNKLYRLARGNVDWAMDIIEEAISNKWKGFFQLKLNGKTIFDYDQYKSYQAEQSGIGPSPTGKPKSILDKNADTLAGEIQKLVGNGYQDSEDAPE